MGFISLIAALLLDHWRPLSPANPAYSWFARYVRQVSGKFDGARPRAGLKAWLLVVVSITISAALITVLLHWAGALFLLPWNIAALYLAFGFRQHSKFYSGVMTALKTGDLPRARELLSAWRGRSASHLSADEISRAAVELALLYSHRHVFGVMAWFIVAGPAGALGYRMAALLAERAPLPKEEGTDKTAAIATLEGYAAHLFHYIDYIPVRLSALMFAVVGDFVGAVRHWRQVVYRYQQGQDIVLASGAGALGSIPSSDSDPASDKSAFEYMQAAGELIWRALVLWLFLIMLGTIVSHL
jgi:cobalamin biosynthesis protein CobD/CbiB